MAIFEVEINGKTFEVDAPDMASAAKAAQAYQADRPGTASGVARAIGQGVSFGFGDELEAALRTLGGLTGDYAQTRDDIRTKIDQFREDSPALAYGSEIAASALAPGGIAAKLAQKGIGMGKAVALGAGGSGALYGAGSAEEMQDVPVEMAKGGGTGLVLGTALSKALPAAHTVAGQIPANTSGIGGAAYSIATGDLTGLAAGLGGEVARKWGQKELTPAASRLADALRKGTMAGSGTTSLTGTSNEDDAKTRRQRQMLAKALTDQKAAADPHMIDLLEALAIGAP